jgi:hypothetical protein
MRQIRKSSRRQAAADEATTSHFTVESPVLTAVVELLQDIDAVLK